METIDFQCPHCGNLLKIPKEHVGKSGKCMKCGGSVQIPVDISGENARGFSNNSFRRRSLVFSFVAIALVLAIAGVFARRQLSVSGGRQGSGGSEQAKQTARASDESGTAQRFRLSPENVLIDSETGLHWFALDTPPVSFSEAERQVLELDHAGGQWRLPTWDELSSLSSGEQADSHFLAWSSEVISEEKKRELFDAGMRVVVWDEASHLGGPVSLPLLTANWGIPRTYLDPEVQHVVAVRGSDGPGS